MLRLLSLGGLALLLELGVAYWLSWPAPLRPAYYPWLLVAAALVMCWGGVEGVAWFLRSSPWSKWGEKLGEWNLLWLSLGAPGALWSGLGLALYGVGEWGGWWPAGSWGAEQFYLGLLLWWGAAPFITPLLWVKGLEAPQKRLLLYSLGGQALALALWVGVYPAPIAWGSLLLWIQIAAELMGHYYFIFMYLLGSAALAAALTGGRSKG